MSSKLAEYAGVYGGIDTTSLNASNILAQWDAALAYMTNQRVNRDRCRCKITPDAYKLLKSAAGITRFVDAASGIRNVDRNVGKLDGVLIEEVPSDVMKTAYTFDTGWAVDAAHAAQINFIIYDPMAIAAPVVYETSMISAPTAQSKGKWLYYERYYYDVFCLQQRGAGIYANVSAAPSLGALTVTSTAGTAAGATVIGVTGDALGQDGIPAANLKMLYVAGESAAVSVTYGAAPNGTKTWVEAGSAPFALTSQTAGKVITVVLVNKQTGLCVAEGHATEVVGE